MKNKDKGKIITTFKNNRYEGRKKTKYRKYRRK
jgi:hypothetical protein